jgi:hypothetical protein
MGSFMVRSSWIREKLRGFLVYYEDGGRRLIRNTGPYLANTFLPQNPLRFKIDIKLETKRKNRHQ